MELRHLRCFLAVAEELHFARAAEKLHIEQSPLSRAIKELEEELGEQLFVRTSRSTRLTRAGKLFLDHVPRVFLAIQQARDSVKAAANGFHSQLRIALSDGITPSRLPALLALCRQEEPEVDLRFFEVPLSQQIKGLHDDLYDVGFARSDEVGEGIAALAVWNDPMMVAVPARHTLLAHKRIPLEEVLRYPPRPLRPAGLRRSRATSGASATPRGHGTVGSGAGGVLRFDDGACFRWFRARVDGLCAYSGQPRTGRCRTTAGGPLADADDIFAAPGGRAFRRADPFHRARTGDRIP
ncbi:Cat operon transcriptional regulator [Achromobacter xylosoxidans]|nr:Cat operon transcriptional regulator [Achromobacter xylosoxidans]